VIIQASLNQIAQNYPAIPKIAPVDGIFGPQTERAVRSFQQIFQLTPDGIVGRSTWYKLVQLYVAVRQLNELTSRGQLVTEVAPVYAGLLSEGSSGNAVSILQTLLGIVAQYDSGIPPVTATGFFDSSTRESVLAFQRTAGLPTTGIVGEATWNALYRRYQGIDVMELNTA